MRSYETEYEAWLLNYSLRLNYQATFKKTYIEIDSFNKITPLTKI